MSLFSKYENGKFYDGRWYCGCDEEVKWRTSGQENSKGERYARCRNSTTENDCKFFLTATDDARARIEKSSGIPPAPKTPTARRIFEAMPTPNTNSSTRATMFRGSSSRLVGSTINDSPTSQRTRAGPGEDDDLASLVVRLLQQGGLTLKSSTESAVRHAIGDRVSKYEAALQNSEKSLAFALNKLGELEGDGGS